MCNQVVALPQILCGAAQKIILRIKILLISIIKKSSLMRRNGEKNKQTFFKCLIFLPGNSVSEV